jgi:BlaI family transcriptional regulator, penicillinase repressor
MAKRRPKSQAPKGDLQAEVMAAVWRLGEAKVDDVRAQLSRPDLAYTTVHTVLTRLVASGLVEREHDGRGFAYRPSIGEAEYLASSFEERLTASSPEVRKAALANLVDALDGSELEQVARYASRIRRERRKPDSS